MTKRDALFGAIIGFIIGALASVYLGLIGKEFPLQGIYFLVFPVLTVLGLFVASLIAKKIPVVYQIAKFGAVGVSNTLIDFLVLLIIANYFSIFKGWEVGSFNIISFTLANVNSFFWNRHWTFEAKEGGKTPMEFGVFFIVSLGGLFVNTSIVAAASTYISPLFGLSEKLWLVAAKIIATLASLVWNFVGYKFFVFKK